MSEKTHTFLKKALTPKLIRFYCIIIILASLFCAFYILGRKSTETTEPYVVTSTSLEKIVKISKLSTFESTYNGIAQVYNEKNPLQIDYYVSYEAIAKVGIDVNDIKISVDHEKKTIVVDLPALEITSITVDPTTLDFIFYNDKRNVLGVSSEALEECRKDANRSATYDEGLYVLASKNAKRTVCALIEPFLKSLDCEYTLTVNQEATRR